MAGAAPSNERPDRRILRFAIGVTMAFAFAQLAAWPMAQLAPVFVAILLQDAGPLSLRKVLISLAIVYGSLVAGYSVAYALSGYPIILISVFALMVFCFYYVLLRSGAHLLAIIGMLLGTLVMPILVQLLPEVAWVGGFGLLVNFAVAMFIAWISYAIIPARPFQDDDSHATLAHHEAVPIAATIAIVCAPLLIAFLMFGWKDILIMVYAAIFATAMTSAAGIQQGWNSTIANLVFGGLAMLVVYEIVVMVPSAPFMVVLMFLVCVIFGRGIFGGGKWAAMWASGFIGFLILLGGAFLSDGVVTSEKVFSRVIQISLAAAYVAFAYGIVDLVRYGLSWTGSRATQVTPTNSEL
jgi:hypothetical protein